ncbi:hypothetical protein [Deinococcus hopiensis]|uniref:Uncharacterized protein n=1 Tax=Deinococcus hopiensis KR-140 TaxID=695939 RepID=A0A1W1UBR1_9DEIO|nr:hypothetical protein [Deinococcus hopiensis]SMB78507.1 hypothetical protein SAMN00790413_06686 [Deinococcus hopiensis KR-140]
MVLRRLEWLSADRSDLKLTFNAPLPGLHADRTPALQECALDLTERNKRVVQGEEGAARWSMFGVVTSAMAVKMGEYA